MERILITGANGFLGSTLAHRALAAGHPVTAVVRPGRVALAHPELRIATIADIGQSTGWEAALANVDVVVHVAGRAHVMRDRAPDPLAEFRRINSQGTKRLAEASARAGVRRLVFVSSIKVSGERTEPARPFRETGPAKPTDPYGISKWEGEQALAEVAARTGLEFAIVRPPLIYGPGVRANFLSLLRWIDRGVPLPFATIDNRRSLVGVSNLADLLLACATHKAAAGQLFLATDGPALSIGDLIRAIAKALGRRANLWPVPRAALVSFGRAFGRAGQMRRLCDSLEIDGTKAHQQLGWRALSSLEDGLRDTARWYQSQAAAS